MIVGGISVRAVPRLQLDSTLAEAGRRLRDAATGIAVVVQDGRLIGTVSERDLAVRGCASGLDPQSASVAEVYDPQPLVCAADAGLRHALQLMRENGRVWLVVVDHAQAPVGAVSVNQLLDLLWHLVPEEPSGPEPEYVHRVRGDTMP